MVVVKYGFVWINRKATNLGLEGVQTGLTGLNANLKQMIKVGIKFNDCISG